MTAQLLSVEVPFSSTTLKLGSSVGGPGASLQTAGVVLLDDTVPSSAEAASRDRDASQREASVWQGDVYRVVMLLDRHHRDVLDWATVTDGGKPQTVVWRRIPGPVRAVSDQLVEATAAATYDDVFADGVPEFFHPMSWSATLSHLDRGLLSG